MNGESGGPAQKDASCYPILMVFYFNELFVNVLVYRKYEETVFEKLGKKTAILNFT